MSRLPLRRAAATAVLLLTATVSGCSDDSADPSASDPSTTPSDVTPSATESASPSPTASPEPRRPKAPPAKDSATGREAFTEFVVDRWSYALRTNEAEALTALSPKSGPCKGCGDLEKELRQRAKQGWYVDFPGARVTKVDVAPGDEPGVHVARAKINVPASVSKFEDGAVRNENEARKGATFEVRMRLDGKRYSLLAFRVG